MTDLLPLELRLEAINYLGNLRMEYLKCFYDPAPIPERYVEGKLTLHVHGSSGSRRWCFTYRREESNTGRSDHKVSVLVRIGETFERSRPLATVARLQALNACLVDIRKPSKITPKVRYISPFLSHAVDTPTMFRIFDRKLCSLLDETRVQDSKFIDKIIKGSAEVIDTFPDKDGHEWWEILGPTNAHWASAGSGHIWLCGEPILLKRGGRKSTLQISQMLLCPTYSRIGIIKGWLSAIGQMHSRTISEKKPALQSKKGSNAP